MGACFQAPHAAPGQDQWKHSFVCMGYSDPVTISRKEIIKTNGNIVMPDISLISSLSSLTHVFLFVTKLPIHLVEHAGHFVQMSCLELVIIIWKAVQKFVPDGLFETNTYPHVK